MRILGIDPGTQAMGYGVVDYQDVKLRMLDYGVLTSTRHTPIAERLFIFYEGLQGILARWEPEEMAIEEPFVMNKRSALAIGRAQAVAMLAAASKGIPVYTYTPTQVKQVATDYGASDKEQVQQMVRIQLELDQIPPNDAADALAVAICHLWESRIGRLLGKSTPKSLATFWGPR